MKIVFVFLVTIGIAAAATTAKPGKCLSSCGKPSVDDIVELIRTYKIDVPTLWSKLGIDRGTGKPTTRKPATGKLTTRKPTTTSKPNLSTIQKSLPQSGTIDVAQLKKSVSSLKKPNFRQILDILPKLSGKKFNLQSIPSTILNTQLNPASIVSKLNTLKPKKASLPSIYNIIFPLLSGNGKPSPTTSRPSVKSTTPVSSSTVKKSLPQSGTVDVAQLKKSVAGLKKPTLGQILEILFKKSNVKFNLKSIPSSVLNSPVDSASITKLNALKTNKSTLPAIYDLIFPSYSSTKPVTSKPVTLEPISSSATTTSASQTTVAPISKTTSPKPKSGTVWNAVSKQLPGKKTQSIQTLKKSISNLENPTLGRILERIFCGAGVKFDGDSIPSKVLNKTVKAKPIIDALSPLNEDSSAQEIFDAVLPAVLNDEDDTDSGLPTTTVSSKLSGTSTPVSPTTLLPKSPVTSSPVSKSTTAHPKSKAGWNVITKHIPHTSTVNVSTFKKSIPSMKKLKFQQILQLLGKNAGFTFNWDSIPSEILQKEVDSDSVQKALEPLKDNSSAGDIIKALRPTFAGNDNDDDDDDDTDSGLLTTAKTPSSTRVASTTSTPLTTTGSSSSPIVSTTPVALVKPITPISSVSPKPDDAWNVIVKSLPRRSTINVTKFIELLSGLKNPTFEQILQLIAKIAGIKFNLKSVPASVLSIAVDNESLQSAMDGLSGEKTVPELFNVIWPVITEKWDENSSSSDVAWNVMVKTLPSRGTVDVTKFKKSLSKLESATFEQILELLGSNAGVTFDLSTIPSEILNSSVNVGAIIDAFSSSEGSLSFSSAFDLIWSSVSSDLDTSTLTTDEELYDSLVIKLPQTGVIEVSELISSITDMKNPKLGSVLKATGSAAGVLFDFEQVPASVVNAPVCIESIKKSLKGLNDTSSIVNVFDAILPAINGHWETVSSSTSGEWRSVIITVPHSDETQQVSSGTSTSGKSTTQKSLLSNLGSLL